eukprot:3159410-Prorocentrum_lima.AAC.1
MCRPGSVIVGTAVELLPVCVVPVLVLLLATWACGGTEFIPVGKVGLEMLLLLRRRGFPLLGIVGLPLVVWLSVLIGSVAEVITGPLPLLDAGGHL